MPAATARTLHGLGGGWYIKGRHTLSFEDPVGRAMMGVSSSLAMVPEAAPAATRCATGTPPRC